MLPYAGCSGLNRGLPRGVTTPTLNLQNFPRLNALEAGIANTLPNPALQQFNAPSFNLQGNPIPQNQAQNILPNPALQQFNAPLFDLQGNQILQYQAQNALPNPALQQFNAPLFNLQGNQYLQNHAQVQHLPHQLTTFAVFLAGLIESIQSVSNNPYQMLPAEKIVAVNTSQNVNLATGYPYAQTEMRPADVMTAQTNILGPLNPTIKDLQFMTMQNYAAVVPVAPYPVTYKERGFTTWVPPRNDGLNHNYIPMKKNGNCDAGAYCRSCFYMGHIEMKVTRCSVCKKLYHTYCFLGSNRTPKHQLVCCDGSTQANNLFSMKLYWQQHADYEMKQKIKQEKRQRKQKTVAWYSTFPQKD